MPGDCDFLVSCVILYINPSKSLTNANGLKSGNNPPLKLTKENIKKKTLIVGDSIVKHADGWRLIKRIRST